MALLRLSKKSRTYVLKSERPEYWEQLIKKLETEVADLKRDDEKFPTKTKELEKLRKQAEKALHLLELCQGPTIWTLHSVDKESVKKEMAKVHLIVGKQAQDPEEAKQQQDLMSGALSYMGLASLFIVRKGLEGWTNLRDPFDVDENGIPKLIDFDIEYVGLFPDEITAELAAEMSGVITEEDIENLKLPS